MIALDEMFCGRLYKTKKLYPRSATQRIYFYLMDFDDLVCESNIDSSNPLAFALIVMLGVPFTASLVTPPMVEHMLSVDSIFADALADYNSY